MLKLRYLVRLATAFVSRFKGLILISAFLGFLAFLLLRFIVPRVLPRRPERIGIPGRHQVENLPLPILSLAGKGLTQFDANGNVVPGLAASWQTPDKGKTWVFNLGKHVWQDGKPVKSEDITYDFSDVSIERPSDSQIVFKLQSPFAPFPSVVTKPVFKRGLLGTGEWQVEKISLNGDIVQDLTLKKAGGERRQYKFYPNEETAKLGFKLGEVDRLEDIFDPEPFTKWKTATVTPTVNENQVVTLFFNTKDSLLAQKNLRQALSYALDKDNLGEPGTERALSSIAPSSWAYNPQVKPYTYDAAHARQLIDELKTQDKSNLNIKLVSTPLLLPLAEKVAREWRAVGVTTTVQVSSVIPTEFQVFLAIYDIPPDPDQYSLWHSTQTGSNITNYQNPRIDKLLEDGRAETDLENRKKIYMDFQRFLLEDAPAVFLYHPEVYTITRK